MTRAAIYFTPDGYLTTGAKLMGRHSAGAGFLRGFAATETSSCIWGHVPKRSMAASFGETMKAVGYAGEVRTLTLDQHLRLADAGCLYVPGPGLADYSWRRLAAGERAYSLCGVTHTTASHAAMESMASLLTAPLRSWDALICTSTAVRDSVRVMLEAQAEYLRWRLGATRFDLPQLPLIPLGVSCEDLAFSTTDRAEARQELGVGDNDIVALFVGRLSFHAKAHPSPMYLALERAAARFPERRIHLVECGWFANEAIDASFRDGAAALCPTVTRHVLDGREPAPRTRAWAAADIFVSLSDNIQETFGLTPIEAMAAGLPVVVSDWDGYRDTVREGIDGFRIPTLMPGAPAGQDLAFRYAAGIDSYDIYCGHTCELVAVDTGAAAHRIQCLIEDPALRRRMGDAGRRRAQEDFDWKSILVRYRELWTDLAERRRSDAVLFGPPPLAERPERMDPFALFAGYPSQLLADAHPLQLVPGANAVLLDARRSLAMNSFAEYVFATRKECAEVLQRVAETPGMTVGTLVAAFPAGRRMALRRGLVWMMKMDVLQLPARLESTR
jgi:glycosyltransferase involved in cell wall biosynthesis